MAAGDFEEIIKGVPREQQKLLERMMEIGLVARFAWAENGKAVVQYTREGKRFITAVHELIDPAEPRMRPSRLLALDLLAENGMVMGGWADDKR